MPKAPWSPATPPTSSPHQSGLKLNRTAFAITAQILMICLCGWILVHGDFLILILLILPAALASMFLALPPLFIDGQKGWIAGAVITVSVNLVIIFAEDIDHAGRSMIPAMTAARDYFFVPTHFVSEPSTAVEWWPKDSAGRTSETLPQGTCVKVVELMAHGEASGYSRVVVLGLDGTRYIRLRHLDGLNEVGRHFRCNENNMAVRVDS